MATSSRTTAATWIHSTAQSRRAEERIASDEDYAADEDFVVTRGVKDPTKRESLG